MDTKIQRKMTESQEGLGQQQRKADEQIITTPKIQKDKTKVAAKI